MPELFASPDAFVQEDRRGGDLDGGAVTGRMASYWLWYAMENTA
jgi:hypothetical protein